MRVRRSQYAFKKTLLRISILGLVIIGIIILARPAAAEPFSIRAETEELRAQLCAQYGERDDGTCYLGPGTEDVRDDSRDARMRALFVAEADLLPVLAQQELAREQITLAELRAELSELQLANDTAVPVEEYQVAVAQLKRVEEDLADQTERTKFFIRLHLDLLFKASDYMDAIKDHCVRNGQASNEKKNGLFWAAHDLCQSEAGQDALAWHRLVEQADQQ